MFDILTKRPDGWHDGMGLVEDVGPCHVPFIGIVGPKQGHEAVSEVSDDDIDGNIVLYIDIAMRLVDTAA